jgi:hypothetical protein
MLNKLLNIRFVPAGALLATLFVWAFEVYHSQIHPDGNGFGGGEALLLWALLTGGLHVGCHIIIVGIEWLLTPQSDGTEVRPLNSPPFPIVIVHEVVEEPERYDEFWDEWEEYT